MCRVLNMSLCHGGQPSAQFLLVLYNRTLETDNTQHTLAYIK